MQPHVLFLGFIMFEHDISFDPEKIRVIREYQNLSLKLVVFMVYLLSIGDL